MFPILDETNFNESSLKRLKEFWILLLRPDVLRPVVGGDDEAGRADHHRSALVLCVKSELVSPNF